MRLRRSKGSEERKEKERRGKKRKREKRKGKEIRVMWYGNFYYRVK